MSGAIYKLDINSRMAYNILQGSKQSDLIKLKTIVNDQLVFVCPYRNIVYFLNLKNDDVKCIQSDTEVNQFILDCFSLSMLLIRFLSLTKMIKK